MGEAELRKDVKAKEGLLTMSHYELHKEKLARQRAEQRAAKPRSTRKAHEGRRASAGCCASAGGPRAERGSSSKRPLVEAQDRFEPGLTFATATGHQSEAGRPSRSRPGVLTEWMSL